MAARNKKVVNDPFRFEGNGISYRAKLIGVEDVPEARGDQMCQDALIKLKNSVKISGEHKRKIFVNVTLEGLKIIDAISLASKENKKKIEPKSPKAGDEKDEQPDKEQDVIVLYSHQVHRISFIARDTTDNRAFGYIFGQEDGNHKFFAIKTAAAAEQLVLSLRDLFQIVYEMKKKEMDEAKLKLDGGEVIDASQSKENTQTSGNGSTSESAQAPPEKASADSENIYQVPTNNAPVNPETKAEQVANLLDLEDQAEHILKDIEQIKNLEFDSIANEPTPPKPSSLSSSSPLAKLAAPASTTTSAVDPWGFSEMSSPAISGSGSGSSALGDLAGLQTGTFSTMGPFPGTTFPTQGGFGAAHNFNIMGGGLPVTKDPFAQDPFGASSQKPLMHGAPGFGGANPFGGGFGQPFGMGAGMMGPAGMMTGMVPHGMISQPGMRMVGNPFGAPAAQQLANPFGDDDNLLKPMKKDGAADPNATSQDTPKSGPRLSRSDLFGDLVDIKKTSPSTVVSPKDLFAPKSEKKSMNELKSAAAKPPGVVAPASAAVPQASDEPSDPFGDRDSIGADRTRGLLLSDSGEEDPFDTSHIPPSLADPSTHNTHSVSSTTSNPPPVPVRCLSSTHVEDTASSSHQPPSSSPPPAPSLPFQSTPPLPSRAPNKPLVTKDFNDNCFLSPLELSLSTASHASSLFMLPSPEEPPPPLPLHLSLKPSLPVAPPPPPPRPHQKSSPLLLPSVPHGNHQREQNTTPNEEFTPSGSTTLPVNNEGPQNVKQLKPQTWNSFENEANFTTCDDKFNPLDATSVNHINAEINEQIECSDLNTDTGAALRSCGKEQSWVGFDQKRSSDPFFSGPNMASNSESDPFNMSIQLTPKFKAVVKYGSDPFDESGSADVWDPFAPSDSGTAPHDIINSLSSPFDDAFGSPAPPVNGNDSLFG